VISIRKKMEESEQNAQTFSALLNTFLSVTSAIPKAALPANPELSRQSTEVLQPFATRLKNSPGSDTIDEAGKIASQQIEAICQSNRVAIEDRDTALKDVVASVAEAISGFRGNGVRHESDLNRLADDFDSLSHIENVSDFRFRLRDIVIKLRETTLEIRRESERSFRQFESQVSVFQQRLETARKESGVDRLTGLGSRREAERHMRNIPRREAPVCVLLFDIEGFRKVNERHGTLFGDKLLRSFAHLLSERFADDNRLYRWGADEFLVIAEGSQPALVESCREICRSFAMPGRYFTTLAEGGRVALTATVAFGSAQYEGGENIEKLYDRVRSVLELSRSSVRQ
jgi:diguanylate cyclase (GGDEF)-like protein